MDEQVITGFIRLQDKDIVSQIPIGVIPLGKTNRFFNREFKGSGQNARTLGNAAMAIVKGATRHINVIEVASDGVRPTYCLSGLNWGLFQEVKAKIDAKKHWWAGPWKKQMAFITRTLRNWPSFYSAELGFDGCSIDRIPELYNDVENSTVKSADRKKNDMSIPSSETSRDDPSINTEICTMNLQIGNDHGDPKLHMQLLDSNILKADFISNGIKWMKNNFNIVRSDSYKEYFAEQVTLRPKMDCATFFHIDGEEFEAKDITVKIHKNKLLFFN